MLDVKRTHNAVVFCVYMCKEVTYGKMLNFFSLASTQSDINLERKIKKSAQSLNITYIEFSI